MTAATARTIIADTFVLGIHAYPQRTPREQLALRERVNTLLARVIRPLPPADRIIVETASGTAVIFLGDPGKALMAAHAVRPALAPDDDAPAPPLLAALNRGPVQLTEAGGTIAVTGDGIAVAQTLAGFAAPGEIVASRAFRDAAGTESAFRPIGTHTDAAVRAHEVFLFDPGSCNVAGKTEDPSIGRRAVVVAAAAAVLLVTAGFGAREARQIIEAQRRPGIIRLAVRPVADVIVDSAYKGTAPPLKTVEVTAGRHTVELKRAGHATRNVQVDLKPGEEIEIQHTFFEKPRPKSFWERLGL